jgi:hypothetical protein
MERQNLAHSLEMEKQALAESLAMERQRLAESLSIQKYEAAAAKYYRSPYEADNENVPIPDQDEIMSTINFEDIAPDLTQVTSEELIDVTTVDTNSQTDTGLRPSTSTGLNPPIEQLRQYRQADMSSYFNENRDQMVRNLIKNKGLNCAAVAVETFDTMVNDYYNNPVVHPGEFSPTKHAEIATFVDGSSEGTIEHSLTVHMEGTTEGTSTTAEPQFPDVFDMVIPEPRVTTYAVPHKRVTLAEVLRCKPSGLTLPDVLEKLGYQKPDVHKMILDFYDSSRRVPDALQGEVLEIYAYIALLNSILNHDSCETFSKDEWKDIAMSADNIAEHLVNLKYLQRKRQRMAYDLDKADYACFIQNAYTSIDHCMKNYKLKCQRIPVRKRTVLPSLPEVVVSKETPPIPRFELNPTDTLRNKLVKLYSQEPKEDDANTRKLLTPKASLNVFRLNTKEVKLFDGTRSQYLDFKRSFKDVYEEQHNDAKALASLLYRHLTGEAKRDVSYNIHLLPDIDTYTKMWKDLDVRYLGEYDWRKVTQHEVNKCPRVKWYMPQTLQWFAESVKYAHNELLKHDSIALQDGENPLYLTLKYKLRGVMKAKFLYYCNDKSLTKNMISLLRWSNHIEEEAELMTEPDSSDDSDNEGVTGVVRSRQHVMYHYSETDSDSDSNTNEMEPQESSDNTSDEESEHEEEPVSDNDTLEITIRAIVQNLRRGEISGEDCLHKDHLLIECPMFKELTVEGKHMYLENKDHCVKCLQPFAQHHDCPNRNLKKCGVKDCKMVHSSLLHTKAMKVMEAMELPTLENITNMYKSSEGETNLQTFVATVSGTTNVQEIVGMLDSGSEACCIDEDLAEELGCITILEDKAHCFGFLDRVVKIPTKFVKVILTNNESTEQLTINCWTVPKLWKGTRALDWSVEKLKYEHLAPLDIPKLPSNKRILLLIGNNCTDCFFPLEVARGENKKEPFGYRTILGWTILGPSIHKSEIAGTDKENLYCMYSKAVTIPDYESD